jgi:plasmid stabilization system protein ParE
VNLARVRLHATFRRDFRAELSWLVEHDRPEWIPNLAPAVKEIADLLRRFPEAGPMQARSPRLILRKIIFRRVPFVAWYGHLARRPIRTVWLLRMFGARQDRPRPDPFDWELE